MTTRSLLITLFTVLSAGLSAAAQAPVEIRTVENDEQLNSTTTAGSMGSMMQIQ